MPFENISILAVNCRLMIMTVSPTRVVSFYINLIDEQIEQLDNHLANDVILYWYGRTVKGKESVVNFLSDEIANPEHNLTSAKAIPEIHYRDISSVSSASSTKTTEEGCAPVNASGDSLLESGCGVLPCEDDFPGRKNNESGLEPLDSSQVRNTPDIKMSEYQRKALLNKPKKQKLNPHPRLPMILSSGHTSLLEARGAISFRRVGRCGYGRPWHRECTLQLAYSCPPIGLNPISCCQFSVIIYSDEMKCRRNLAQVFEHMNIAADNMKDFHYC